jgi:hypothetical protein
MFTEDQVKELNKRLKINTIVYEIIPNIIKDKYLDIDSLLESITLAYNTRSDIEIDIKGFKGKIIIHGNIFFIKGWFNENTIGKIIYSNYNTYKGYCKPYPCNNIKSINDVVIMLNNITELYLYERRLNTVRCNTPKI